MSAALTLSAAVPARFGADTVRDADAALRRVERLAQSGAATPFQRADWLNAWYASRKGVGGVEPLFAFITDAARGADVMALPLVLLREGGRRAVEFADGGVTDYNGPVLAPDAPADAASARQMWRALLRALPPCDILRLTKMPREIGGRANPLALAPGARAARLAGNVLRVPGPWDDYHRGLERTFRKELERSWRVFSKCEGAAFRRVTDAAEARAVYASLRKLQAGRIAELGHDYVLDAPENDALYAGLIETGLASGRVVLTALTAGDEVVAALLGIRDGATYAMVRLAAAGGEWKRCSPGRLIIERTMRHLHAQGVRAFDFTIGDYPYKRRLGAVPAPLAEIVRARSWRGLAEAGFGAAKAVVRERPALMALARRLRG